VTQHPAAQRNFCTGGQVQLLDRGWKCQADGDFRRHNARTRERRCSA